MSLTRRQVAVGLPAGAALVTMAGAAQAAGSAETFRALADAEWAWRLEQFADDEDSRREVRSSLPDVGPEAQAGRLARWRDVQNQLSSFDPASFSAEDRINFEVYKGQI